MQPLQKLIQAELQSRITAIVAECAEIPVDRIVASQSLHRHGVDSLAGVNIAYEIGLLAGRDVPPNIVTEFDTIDKLVQYVLDS